MIVDKQLVVSRKKKADLVIELRNLQFRAFPKVSKAKVAGEDEPLAEDDDDQEESTKSVPSDFDYLLGMAISSLTEERVCTL